MTALTITKAVEYSLWEDLQDIGDITANALIPTEYTCYAKIFSKENGILYGTDYIVETFHQIDSTIDVHLLKNDGDTLNKGDSIALISGSTQKILTAERTALNFIGHLSGIASTTAKAIEIAKPYGTTIACTRKTTPMLRNPEKYAVKAGGGSTHRFGLYDAVMIKDNHLVAITDIVQATQTLQNALTDTLIEVEVDTLEQLKQVLPQNPDVVLLDNMPPNTIIEAIAINTTLTNGTVKLEASGNITLDTLKQYCETGVDIISMGWLTHSAKNLDVSLEILGD